MSAFFLKGDVANVENALKSAMVKGPTFSPVSTDMIWGFDNSATQIYDVEATKVEPVLDQVIEPYQR